MPGVATAPDGVEIQYDALGSGRPALVFVHGWSCDRSYWAKQLPVFSKRHRVLAIDLAGHGDSGTRPVNSMPAFGGDVAAVMAADGIDDAVLVGHSMGGDVIPETALLVPDAVRALVWVDAYSRLGTPMSPDDVDAFVDRFRADFPAAAQAFVRSMFPPDADPAVVDFVARDMASAPPPVALDAMAHALSNHGRILDQLPRLRCPVVALNPGHRPTDQASLARFGVRTMIQPGVGHFGMLEDPATFNRLLAKVVATFV